MVEVFYSARIPISAGVANRALMSSQSLLEVARVSKAWPFEEARKLIERLKGFDGKEVIFETGYGPSGLPHIGTFGEVARTTMVRQAFRLLTGDTVETRLIAFSDDMDGLRKTPDNIPNREMIEEHLGKPLTQVPDPFGNTNSCLRPKVTSLGCSTERCCGCSNALTRCKRSCCHRCARSARPPIPHFYRSTPALESSSRRPYWDMM